MSGTAVEIPFFLIIPFQGNQSHPFVFYRLNLQLNTLRLRYIVCFVARCEVVYVNAWLSVLFFSYRCISWDTLLST